VARLLESDGAKSAEISRDNSTTMCGLDAKKTEEQIDTEFESVNQYGGTSRWHNMRNMSGVGWCQLDDVCTCH
jgi:hypothetical protein